MPQNKKSIIDRLKGLFKIADVRVQGNMNQDQMLYPATVNPKSGKPSPIEFPDEIQRLYDYWLRDSFESSETLKNRIERYTALSYAYYNNSIFSKAVNLYADETVQSEEGNEVLLVEAKEKSVKKYVIDFLQNLGLNNPQKLHNIAFNLVLYGDAFQINSMDLEKNRGINEITDVDVYAVGSRLEFNASEIAKELRRNRKWTSSIQKDTRMNALHSILDSIGEAKDYSQFFKKFLFGYWLSDKLYLPPWNVSHFRIYTTISEFAPYGRPLMINSLAPFRQLQAGKNLMALARATNFPIKKFEVEVDEHMDQADKWEAINEIKEDYHNLGYNKTDNEQFAMGGEIWVPSGLVSFEQIETRLDLDAIADIEMLRDDLIMGTDIPKGYLIVDRASFGTSGQSLLRQHKPFARAVYKIQTAMMEEISHLIRMQFLVSGDYDYDTPFDLSMPFPEIEESSDRLRMKNDTLRLAKDVMDNIGDAIGLDRGEALPPEVVKAVMSQISFLDDDDVRAWVDKTIKAQRAEPEEPEAGGDGNFGSFYGSNKIVSSDKLTERLTPSLINECAYTARKNGQIKEHIADNRHHYSSTRVSEDKAFMLKLMDSTVDPSDKDYKKLRESLLI